MRKILFILLFAFVAAGCRAQTIAEADSLHTMGKEILAKGNAVEGRELTGRALKIKEKLLGKENESYINSLNNVAYSYFMERNWSHAAELQKEVVALCAKLKKPHPAVCMYTYNLGRYEFLSGDTVNAVKTWERALTIAEKYSQDYEQILNGLTYAYGETNDKKNIMRIMALVEDHNQHELTKPCNEPECMIERAQYYAAKGDRAMARDCFLKAFTMKLTSEQEVELYKVYAEFIGLDDKDFGGAADYFFSIANGQNDLHLDYETRADLYYYAGTYAFLAKDYDFAINSFQSALNLYNDLDSIKDPKKFITTLKTLGFTYNAQKDRVKAIECFRELVDYYEKNDTASEEYPKAILRLAKAEKFDKLYSRSIVHHEQAMSIFDQRGMAEEYTEAARSLQLCYSYAGIDKKVDMKEDAAEVARKSRLDQMIQQETSDLNMTLTFHGKESYAQSLGTIAGCYKDKGDLINCVKYYKLYIPALRDAVREQFRLSDANARMRFWNDIQKSNMREIRTLLQDMEVEDGPLAADANGVVYDAELLSKGILLNSSIEFENVLYGLHNEKLTDAYTRLKANEERIVSMRKSATSQASLDSILALTRQNEALQLELYRGCAEYADFTNYISYTWTDVRQALLDGDVAIEFAVVGDSPFPRENQMMALVLTKDMMAPVAVAVCNLESLERMAGDEAFLSSQAYTDSIWGPLRQWVEGKRRVFFSADGALNRMAIEYMSNGGRPLSEQLEMYRLSSTKELCYSRKQPAYTKVALFGDINYNDDATSSESSQRSLALMRGSDGFADLANTKREISEIENILRSKGLTDIVDLRNTEASRKAFLSLDNSRVNILHVATHGMYRDDLKATDAQSMDNSLLAFAGANLDDDGLVTAADIAKMNLRLCDIAVLSACETGLGRLGGDGVFGLQRGFKNAGVHTLLMSLRNVYDNTTADMMISFYRNLLNGSTKREALVKAQREIRDKGFSDPKYWATFILLDAM